MNPPAGVAGSVRTARLSARHVRSPGARRPGRAPGVSVGTPEHRTDLLERRVVRDDFQGQAVRRVHGLVDASDDAEGHVIGFQPDPEIGLALPGYENLAPA